jgi:hypothetical protein
VHRTTLTITTATAPDPCELTRWHDLVEELIDLNIEAEDVRMLLAVCTDQYGRLQVPQWCPGEES